MRSWTARASLLLVLAGLPGLVGAEPPLRLLVTTGTSLPFADISQSAGEARLQGGIVRDWGQALARRLGREAQFLLMPARRIGQQLRDGGFDLQCFENPQWYDAQDQTWIEWLPRPLMDVVEELVSRPGLPRVSRLEQLQGRTVGVVAGFRYPLLDPLFESGRIQRSLAHSEQSLLQMQRLGRTDYSVISRLQFAYARAHDPELRTLVVSPLEVSRTRLYCLRQRGSPIPLPELAAAQQALLAEGRLDAILQQYR